MSNIALIFAAGKGLRMNNPTPKQFLEINKKPIISYTIEKFETSKQIDKILIITLKDKIEYTKKLIKKYKYKKVIGIIPGGKTAIQSQYLGLCYLKDKINDNDIVLIHDGVRPFINETTINKVINITKKYGNCVTISPSKETISFNNTKGEIISINPRENCFIVRAPQSFYFKDLFGIHNKAIKDKLTFVDSASMMIHYGIRLKTITGPIDNIKITTEDDFLLSKTIIKGHK